MAAIFIGFIVIGFVVGFLWILKWGALLLIMWQFLGIYVIILAAVVASYIAVGILALLIPPLRNEGFVGFLAGTLSLILSVYSIIHLWNSELHVWWSYQIPGMEAEKYGVKGSYQEYHDSNQAIEKWANEKANRPCRVNTNDVPITVNSLMGTTIHGVYCLCKNDGWCYPDEQCRILPFGKSFRGVCLPPEWDDPNGWITVPSHR